MVVLVFLLQTVNITRRSTTLVLALALESGILASSAYGLSTTCAIGISLAMIHFGASHTLPFLTAIGAVFISNVGLVLFALSKALLFLGSRRVARLREQLILEQVDRITLNELGPSRSQYWMVKELEGSQLLTIFDQIEGGTWEVLAPGRKTVADLDLKSMNGIANQYGLNAKVQILCRIGEIPREGTAILRANFPDDSARKALEKTVKWRRAPDVDEDNLLEDASKDFIASIRNGDFGGFQEGMTLCASVTRCCLASLETRNLGSAEGALDLKPMREVRGMLRHGLEEALKTRRSDFVFEIRASLREIAMAAYEYKNRKVFEFGVSLFPFVRNIALRIGLQNEEVFEDIHWRPLREMATFTIPRLATQDDGFSDFAILTIRKAFVHMLRDSIASSAPDLEELLRALQLTFGEPGSPRRNRLNEKHLPPSDQAADAMFILLGGWTIHLCELNKLDRLRARDILKLLATQITSPSTLLSATITALDDEDCDRTDLSDWIIFSYPETGKAHVIDTRSIIVAASLAMVLLRWGSVRNIAERVEGADRLASEIEQVTKSISDQEGRFHQIYSGLGLITPDFLAAIRDIELSIGQAKQDADNRKRVMLRQLKLDVQKVEAL